MGDEGMMKDKMMIMVKMRRRLKEMTWLGWCVEMIEADEGGDEGC